MQEIVSRSDAAALGLRLFYSGTPCRAGHYAYRYVVNGSCSTCQIERAKKRHAENPGRSAEQKRRRKAANPELISAQKAAYYAANKERIAKYLGRNKTAIAKRQAAYYSENRDSMVAAMKRWSSANRVKISRRRRERYSSDPKYRASELIRDEVKRMVRATKAGRSAKAFRNCGYSQEDFRVHIEGLFKPGMTWANHGQWHVDHKVPLSVLVASGETDLKVVNRLSNLQPLWAQENILKGSSLAG